MKTHIQLGIFLMLTTGFLSFAGSEKTIENLKSAYNGEYNASIKYADFADQARKEGLTNIAIMFSATSKAEAIHAENHKKVLSRMGQTV
ncbi:MAG: ferritin family protein, partial [Bacteroidales bacterium]|nr:ferritin family protein [Bacteroidales bacterium]